MLYKIRVQKEIGGECASEPIVTIEGKAAAARRYADAVTAAEQELNAEIMRVIGGKIDVILERCAHIIGDGELERFTTIKRPIHSPQATVCEQ